MAAFCHHSSAQGDFKMASSRLARMGYRRAGLNHVSEGHATNLGSRNRSSPGPGGRTGAWGGGDRPLRHRDGPQQCSQRRPPHPTPRCRRRTRKRAAAPALWGRPASLPRRLPVSRRFRRRGLVLDADGPPGLHGGIARGRAGDRRDARRRPPAFGKRLGGRNASAGDVRHRSPDPVHRRAV